MRARGNAALDQVLRDRGEILIRTRAIFAQRGLVPARPVFAAAANVRDDITAAAFEPYAADAAAVVRHLGNFESAVAVEERRMAAVGVQVLARDDEIRNARAALRCDEVLVHVEAGRVEERRRLLDRPCFACAERAG